MQVNEPGAHIDHMLRQTRMHNAQLSTMADMKASMLLTVSSLVLGLSLSHLSGVPGNFVFIVLAACSAITIALAIYATMPNAGLLSFRKATPDTTSSKFTLLFFGDYSNLSYDEFSTGMEAVMNDHNLNYEAQIKEIYNMGYYLASQKFRKLRLAYISFLTGTMLSFVIALLHYFQQ